MISSAFSASPFLYNQANSWGIWPYILLALLVAVEGPLATLAAAVASSAGYLDPRLVFASAALGNLSADIVWYSIGYAGNMEWVVKYGGWLGIKQNVILRLKQGINEHVGTFLFIAKLTLGLVVPTLIAAGLARVSWRRWFWVLLSAESIWTGGLVLFGYYYGQYVLKLENSLKWLSISATIILAIVAGLYVLQKKTLKDNE